MNKIGFLKSDKKGEKRIAILPKHLIKMNYPQYVYIERGYGLELGYTDSDYIKNGAYILERDEILNLNVICDPKIGDSNYVNNLGNNKILFGYFHAVQNQMLTNTLVEKNTTCLAWEDMYEGGQHCFWKNNELAGEAAILHAFMQFGKLPRSCKCALIGRGNVAMGAYKVLSSLGSDVVIYNRHMEDKLRKELNEYDVIINAVLWDTSRTDHIITTEELKLMKPKSMIIDISCDKNGGIESSRPTSIDNPTYSVNGVLHYVVDHTPAILYHEASDYFGDEVVKYIDKIITNDYLSNITLKKSMIIKNGKIIDSRITDFQRK